MDVKKILKGMTVVFLMALLFYLAHETYLVSASYEKMEAYKGNVKGKEDFPDFEYALWGNESALSDLSARNLSARMGSSDTSADDAVESSCGNIGSAAIPDFSDEALFGQSAEKIIYGKIERLQDVVCKAGKMTLPDLKIGEELEKEVAVRKNAIPTRRKYKYNACLVKIRVFHNIYGDLEEKKTYWILMGEDDLILRGVAKGDRGLFVIFHNPTFVFLKDSLELVPIVGNITGLGLREIPYILEKDTKEDLSSLKTKKDVTRYWKNHLKTRRYNSVSEIELTGKNIYSAGRVPIDPEEELYAEEMTSYIEDSDVVFEGEILKIDYFTDSGEPYTRYTVKNRKTHYGRIKGGEVVTVFQKGGYMPFWIFRRSYPGKQNRLEGKNPSADDLIEVDLYQEGQSDMGKSRVSERAVFFAVNWRDGEGDSSCQGDYCLTGDVLSKIRYDAEKKVFVERVDPEDPKKVNLYSKKEWEKKLENVLICLQ